MYDLDFSEDLHVPRCDSAFSQGGTEPALTVLWVRTQVCYCMVPTADLSSTTAITPIRTLPDPATLSWRMRRGERDCDWEGEEEEGEVLRFRSSFHVWVPAVPRYLSSASQTCTKELNNHRQRKHQGSLDPHTSLLPPAEEARKTNTTVLENDNLTRKGGGLKSFGTKKDSFAPSSRKRDYIKEKMKVIVEDEYTRETEEVQQNGVSPQLVSYVNSSLSISHGSKRDGGGECVQNGCYEDTRCESDERRGDTEEIMDERHLEMVEERFEDDAHHSEDLYDRRMSREREVSRSSPSFERRYGSGAVEKKVHSGHEIPDTFHNRRGNTAGIWQRFGKQQCVKKFDGNKDEGGNDPDLTSLVTDTGQGCTSTGQPNETVREVLCPTNPLEYRADNVRPSSLLAGHSNSNGFSALDAVSSVLSVVVKIFGKDVDLGRPDIKRESKSTVTSEAVMDFKKEIDLEEVCLPSSSTQQACSSVRSNVCMGSDFRKAAFGKMILTEASECVIVVPIPAHEERFVESSLHLRNAHRYRNKADAGLVFQAVHFANTVVLYGKDTTRKHHASRISYKPKWQPGNYADTDFIFPKARNHNFVSILNYHFDPSRKWFKTRLEFEVKSPQSTLAAIEILQIPCR